MKNKDALAAAILFVTLGLMGGGAIFYICGACALLDYYEIE